jgi:dihydrofolate reductase
MATTDPDHDVELVAVAAVAENGVIGDGRELPWHLPHESRRYRERVAEEVVALGRRTHDMMTEDPAGKYRIVLSRSDREYEPPEYHAGGVGEAIEWTADLGADELYVLGGEAIYRLFLPHFDRMLLSRVHGEYEGDAHFPEFDRDQWHLADSTDFEGYTLEEWVRAGSG